MDQAVLTPDLAPAPPSAVVELRQYELHPGQRDVLIDLFETHFVTGQEAIGIRLHGEFRDVDAANRFVWLRGFASMSDRPRVLDAFYTGDLWKAHRAAANATMVDVGNVLLLQPVAEPAFSLAGRMSAFMVAIVYLLHSPVDVDFTRFFAESVGPIMAATGAPPVAQLRTLYAENNYARLAVREGEHAFVWFAAFASVDEYRGHLAKLGESAGWKAVEEELGAHLKSPAVRLRLSPTARSLARHRPQG